MMMRIWRKICRSKPKERQTKFSYRNKNINEQQFEKLNLAVPALPPELLAIIAEYAIEKDLSSKKESSYFSNILALWAAAEAYNNMCPEAMAFSESVKKQDVLYDNDMYYVDKSQVRECHVNLPTLSSSTIIAVAVSVALPAGRAEQEVSTPLVPFVTTPARPLLQIVTGTAVSIVSHPMFFSGKEKATLLVSPGSIDFGSGEAAAILFTRAEKRS